VKIGIELDSRLRGNDGILVSGKKRDETTEKGRGLRFAENRVQWGKAKRLSLS
jgi:hypothetical protein